MKTKNQIIECVTILNMICLIMMAVVWVVTMGVVPVIIGAINALYLLWFCAANDCLWIVRRD